jgi:hypothetical protein
LAAQHIAQLEKDHHRRNQKENGAEVEETHIFRQSIPALAGPRNHAGRRSHSVQHSKHIEREAQSFKSKAGIPI